MTEIENLYSEELGECIIELSEIEAKTILALDKNKRAFVIDDIVDYIMDKYGEHYEGTPEYGSVLSEVIFAVYEELLEYK